MAYLTTSGSVTAAARMLHLHLQSLRYRLSRLPVTVQQSLKHPRERLTIELALEARTLVPPTPPPGSDELDPPEP
ncbi:MAG: helix-turn-helix domain-containing protein [Iamia sp.]